MNLNLYSTINSILLKAKPTENCVTCKIPRTLQVSFAVDKNMSTVSQAFPYSCQKNNQIESDMGSRSINQRWAYMQHTLNKQAI